MRKVIYISTLLICFNLHSYSLPFQSKDSIPSGVAERKEKEDSKSPFISFVHHWEWILIILLITIDVTLFVTSRKEKKERESLIREMIKTREELGREEYLNMILSTLKTAKKYNYWTSHTLTSKMTDIQKNEIFSNYKADIDNKLLTAKDISKIKFMLEQKRHGVEVRVNDLLLISTFRFQIVDNEKTVLGFAKKGVNESRKGILISDKYFTIALREHFENLWKSSLPLMDYLKEILTDFKVEKIEEEAMQFVEDWNLSAEELTEIGLIKNDLLKS